MLLWWCVWTLLCVCVCACRRLFQFGSAENNAVVALYEKMTLTMTETERLKPDFLEVARILWSVTARKLRSPGLNVNVNC